MKKIQFFLGFMTLAVSMVISLDLSAQANEYAPTVIPPSPEAGSLAKYVDFQSSTYTGQTHINIPLYNFVEGSIQIPISLSYKSGGFNVEELSNQVGLGWTLNASGVVTRSMRGKPDEFKIGDGAYGFLDFSTQTSYEYISGGPEEAARYDYLKGISDGCYDAQPDIFYFNAVGYTAKFQFDWNRNLVVDSEFPMSVEIIWSGGFNSSIDGWRITVADGKIFELTAKEETETQLSNFTCGFVPLTRYTSSWHLTRVSDADANINSRRYVDFSYEDYTLTNYDVNNSASRTHAYSGACGGSFSGSASYSNNILTIKGKRLTRISSKFSPIEVLFQKGDARTDVSGTNLHKLQGVVARRIADQEIIKQFDLVQDYRTNRLTLLSVQERSGLLNIPPYRFEYSGTLKDPDTKSRDHWGFENKNSVNDLFPPYAIENQSLNGTVFFGTADRSPDLEGSRSGVLTKITFPTGGYDTYSYELNDYSIINGTPLNEYIQIPVAGTVSISGNVGLGCSSGNYNERTFSFTVNPNLNSPADKVMARVNIGQISSFSSFGAGSPPKVEILNAANEIEHSYGISDSGNQFFVELSPGNYTLKASAKWKSCLNSEADRAVGTISFQNFGTALKTSKPAGGVRVHRIEKRDKDGTLLRSINYDYLLASGASSGFVFGEPDLNVYYTNQFKCLGDPQSNQCNQITCGTVAIASTSHVFNLGATQGNHIGYKRVIATEGDGSNGSTTYEYRINGNLIHKEAPFAPPTEYDFLNGLVESSVIKNATGQTVQDNSYSYTSSFTTIPALTVGFKGGDNFPIAKYDLGPHTTILGHAKQSSMTGRIYDSQGNHAHENVSRTVFDRAVQNVEESIQEVNGKEVITRTYYAGDVNNPTHPGVVQLNNLDMSGVPIEVVTLVREGQQNYVTGAVYYSFDNSPNLSQVYTLDLKDRIPESQFVPAISNSGHRSTAYTPTPEVTLSWGLQKNLESNLADGVSSAYLYDQHYLPIASVTGANGDQVFHTSFENSGTSGHAKTGEKYRNSGNFTFSSNGGFTPAPGVVMKMSYWYYEANTWKYSGEVTFNNTINRGTKLDEVRAYPEGSLMTTYAYHYGYGVSSTTDPNGITSYYEYDALGRLIKSKDQDLNILQQNQYNYGSND